jgi:hypothetical protein
MSVPLALRQQRPDAQRIAAGLHAQSDEAEIAGRIGQRMQLAVQLFPVCVTCAVCLAQRERVIHFLEAHKQASANKVDPLVKTNLPASLSCVRF